MRIRLFGHERSVHGSAAPTPRGGFELAKAARLFSTRWRLSRPRRRSRCCGLQEREFERWAANKPKSAPTCGVAQRTPIATCKAAIAEGSFFRRDFSIELNVFPQSTFRRAGETSRTSSAHRALRARRKSQAGARSPGLLDRQGRCRLMADPPNLRWPGNVRESPERHRALGNRRRQLGRPLINETRFAPRSDSGAAVDRETAARTEQSISANTRNGGTHPDSARAMRQPAAINRAPRRLG